MLAQYIYIYVYTSVLCVLGQFKAKKCSHNYNLSIALLLPHKIPAHINKGLHINLRRLNNLPPICMPKLIQQYQLSGPPRANHACQTTSLDLPRLLTMLIVCADVFARLIFFEIGMYDANL